MGTPDKQIQTLKSIVKLMGTPDQTQEQNRENVTKIVTANIFVPFFLIITLPAHQPITVIII